MQSTGLTLDHVCDKESTIVVQHNVNNIILTEKEKRVLRNKWNRSKKKNVEEDIEA